VRNLLQWLIDHAEAREEERAQARDLLDQAHPADPAAEAAPPAPPAAPWAAPGVAPEGGSQL
jgi:hypothetical protein